MFSLIAGPGVLGTQPAVVYLCPLTSCAAAGARAPQPPGRPSGTLALPTPSPAAHTGQLRGPELCESAQTQLFCQSSPQTWDWCASWATSSLEGNSLSQGMPSDSSFAFKMRSVSPNHAPLSQWPCCSWPEVNEPSQLH